jgi:hypothetical protein
MARATIFYAKLPNGVVAKRSSQTRTYTHCVAIRESFEHALKSAEDAPARSLHEENYRYYLACAAGKHEHVQFAGDDTAWKKASAERRLAEAKRVTAKWGDDVESYLDERRQQEIAAVYAARDAGWFDCWGVVGWNSRLDLAEKEASHRRSREGVEDVVILEATTHPSGVAQ